jgi:multiple sugar transport system permease protein
VIWWDRFGTVLVNLLAWFLVIVYLLPMLYMVATAFKTPSQLSSTDAPPWPARRVTYDYQGEDYIVYHVPADAGMQEWALITPRREFSEFIDPAHPEQGLIHWEGSWRSLDAVYELHLTWENFVEFGRQASFMRAVGNSLTIAGVAGAGSLIASILVAYGFARFPVPAGRVLFILLIGSIMLPEKVTLIPTYFMYTRVLGWTGTWAPLIVPHLFGSAVMIFLLRQNFKSIPKEVEEAAVLDGAGPLRVLISIILPQAIPTIVTVALLQFFFFWNETRNAALYLASASNRHTVSFWLQNYGFLGTNFNQLQAVALLVMAVPVVGLFLAQRVFMRGVIVTGTEK